MKNTFLDAIQPNEMHSSSPMITSTPPTTTITSSPSIPISTSFQSMSLLPVSTPILTASTSMPLSARLSIPSLTRVRSLDDDDETNIHTEVTHTYVTFII